MAAKLTSQDCTTIHYNGMFSDQSNTLKALRCSLAYKCQITVQFLLVIATPTCNIVLVLSYFIVHAGQFETMGPHRTPKQHTPPKHCSNKTQDHRGFDRKQSSTSLNEIHSFTIPTNRNTKACCPDQTHQLMVLPSSYLGLCTPNNGPFADRSHGLEQFPSI